MMNLLGSKKTNALSVLKDPFKKDKWTAVHIHMYSPSKFGSLTIQGTVEFQNGNTSGEQKFVASSFQDLVTQIENFMTTLQ